MMENKELICKAVDYARQNADDNTITLEDVAVNAGFSIDYFNRIFMAHTGFTVMAYISYLRLKKAVRLLRTTDRSVLDIALEVGYDSHEGFAKAFKKRYGTSPSEYRVQKKGQILTLGEIVDKTVSGRFLHDNPDFQLIDTDELIDYLLEKDAVSYGYLCGVIKYCGLVTAAPGGNWERGFIGIGDNGNGECYLEILTEDWRLLAEWIKRFPQRKAFYSDKAELEVCENLKAYGVEAALKMTPHAVYFGESLKVGLKEDLDIRLLTAADEKAILKWAHGRRDAYIDHLLNKQHYLDECNLEYGVFENRDLIAIAGCGIDEVHGMRLNNCCQIRFTEGKADDCLYRMIFAYVTNDICDKGAIPFDDIQHGEYAQTHGKFTSVDMGYQIVNRRYDVLGK